jgi:HEAT repeat protein
LITAALNSKDRKVRDSAIEVQLAAYRLTKRDSTVDALVKQARSSDHAQQIWALWSMGLLANRGIGTGRIIEVLAARLKASDHGLQERAEDVRLWAVQSLALIGTAASIEPLLDAMRHDPSAMVRERAASGLADSLMLSHDQRMLAVPQLIDFSGDPSLDAQTRAWAFQALADITQERLPSTSAAWREWYRLHGRG